MYLLCASVGSVRWWILRTGVGPTAECRGRGDVRREAAQDCPRREGLRRLRRPRAQLQLRRHLVRVVQSVLPPKRAQRPRTSLVCLYVPYTVLFPTLGWRAGAMVGRRTCDQEVASSIPGRARLRTTNLGKLFTPNCLDADSLCYYIESLNWLPSPFFSDAAGTLCGSAGRVYVTARCLSLSPSVCRSHSSSSSSSSS